MSADIELRDLACRIVNALDECEAADRTKVVDGLIWNFLYGMDGRITKFREFREQMCAEYERQICSLLEKTK